MAEETQEVEDRGVEDCRTWTPIQDVRQLKGRQMYLHLDTAVGEVNVLIGDVVLGEEKELSKILSDVEFTDNIATEEVKEEKMMSGDGDLVPVVQTEEEKTMSGDGDLVPVVQTEEEKKMSGDGDLVPVVQTEEEKTMSADGDLVRVVQTEEEKKMSGDGDLFV